MLLFSQLGLVFFLHSYQLRVERVNCSLYSEFVTFSDDYWLFPGLDTLIRAIEVRFTHVSL